ncbi:MAG: hypothetical protein EAZ42_08495 [Verrucomicrobia bacterium]|nr:MAG: hypothetical protein EAZ42_08495 [Verrucomicrobiota bacterium]
MGMLATLTAGVLMFAMILGAFAGNEVVVRFEHSHEEGHHEESKHGHPSDDSHDDQAPSDDTHHHHLTVQISPAIFTPLTSLCISFSPILGYLGLPRSLHCPEGPYFELIKPPQNV